VVFFNQYSKIYKCDHVRMAPPTSKKYFAKTALRSYTGTILGYWQMKILPSVLAFHAQHIYPLKACFMFTKCINRRSNIIYWD